MHTPSWTMRTATLMLLESMAIITLFTKYLHKKLSTSKFQDSMVVSINLLQILA